MSMGRAKLMKGRIPFPVFELQLANGKRLRMSFWSEKEKPIDVERGRRVAEFAKACSRAIYAKAQTIGEYVYVDGKRYTPEELQAAKKKQRANTKKAKEVAKEIRKHSHRAGDVENVTVPSRLLKQLYAELRI